MKALTVKQPWAWAIAQGLKKVENRSWVPPRPCIGQRFALHAGMSRPDDASLMAMGNALKSQKGMYRTNPDFHLGAVIATFRYAGFVTLAETLVEDQRPWFWGPFGWIVEDVRTFDPIRCAGALNLWRLPDNVLDLIPPDAR